MKHLVYTENGKVKVATGTVAQLEQIETDGSERWFNAFAATAVQAKATYEAVQHYEQMVKQYGADEINWPEE